MKKTTALVLLVVLLLSLMACGKSSETTIPMASKEEQAAYDAACELMEQERYGEAADAFANIPLYGAIWDKLNEINRLTGSASADALTGTWYDLNDSKNDKGYYFDFPGNGKAVFGSKIDSGGIVCPCSVEGSSLYITVSSTNTTYRMNIVEIDGITHIKGQFAAAGELDLVSATYYDALKPAAPSSIEPVKITLTVDNWKDYFEIRPYKTSQTNNWGETYKEREGFAFYLKDEYLDRYIQGEEIEFYLKDTNNSNPHHFYAYMQDSRQYGAGVYGIISYEGESGWLAELTEQSIEVLSVVNVIGQLNLKP